MRTDQTSSILVLLIGIALLAASLLSDVIGIGDRPGFGAQQTMGVVVGAALAAIGLFFILKKISDKTPSVILLVMGIALLATSLLSDFVGIGDNPEFGKQQIMGTCFGVLMAAVGLFFTLKKE